METIKRKLPNGATSIVHRASSLADAARFASENPNPKSSAKTTDNEWSGTPSLPSAVKLATDGWHDVRPKVQEMFNQLESQLSLAMDEQFSIRYDYSGDSVDMGRYVSGDPECMMDYVTEPQARMGRVVRVLVAGIASAYVTPEQIQARGVAVCALIDVLHKLGVGIELWTEQCYARPKNNKDKYSMLVKLHDSQDMMDIDDIMFAIAHPSMLRRIGFGGVEQMQWANEYINSGYGSVSDMVCADMLGGDCDVVVEKLQNGGRWGTESDILADPVNWVLNTVKGLDLI
jgi:hypothetical protein